jgi:large subunit ribosomal protein L25
MSELTIRCDPVNIPRRIEADVTHVVIGHSIHVSDLKVPEGVEILDDAETTIAVVSAPKVEAEAAPAEGAPAEGEPELIRKTKEDEEEGESK